MSQTNYEFEQIWISPFLMSNLIMVNAAGSLDQATLIKSKQSRSKSTYPMSESYTNTGIRSIRNFFKGRRSKQNFYWCCERFFLQKLSKIPVVQKPVMELHAKACVAFLDI